LNALHDVFLARVHHLQHDDGNDARHSHEQQEADAPVSPPRTAARCARSVMCITLCQTAAAFHSKQHSDVKCQACMESPQQVIRTHDSVAMPSALPRTCQ
jgi:hypothetical protein